MKIDVRSARHDDATFIIDSNCRMTTEIESLSEGDPAVRDDEGFDPGDRKLLDDVDRHGWHVVKVTNDETDPGFAYSVGMFHTFRQPEIIVVGMDLKVMHWMINEAGEWVREGRPIRPDTPYSGLLEGYDCIFRPVAKKFYRDYFGYALWFYRDDEFPVLQCIWPDKEGHWPWNEDFNPAWKSMQPLLQ